jgi:hypothetical protein
MCGWNDKKSRRDRTPMVFDRVGLLSNESPGHWPDYPLFSHPRIKYSAAKPASTKLRWRDGITYEPVGQWLLFKHSRQDTATGASSAMEQLLADLKHNHNDIAARVVGSVAVDEHHLTEGELLAKAREMFVVK